MGWAWGGPSSALQPELVDVGGSVAQIAAELKPVMQYDGTILDNPPGTSIPHRSCYSKYWGACPAETLFRSISDGAFNMYALLCRWQLNRDRMPLVARFKPVDAPEEDFKYCLIVNTVGRGETVLLAQLASWYHPGRSWHLVPTR